MRNVKLLATIVASFATAIGVGATQRAWAAEGSYMSQPPPTQQRNLPMGERTSAAPSKGVRPDLAKSLNEAVDLGKNKNFQAALAKVKEADAAITDKTADEEFVVAKLIGQFSAQLNDNASAAAAFNRALASNAVPSEERPQILGIVMAVNINAKNYDKAVSAGEELQKLGKMNADQTTNLALAYYLKGDYPNALKTAKAAVDMQSAGGGKPSEQALSILQSAQVKTGDKTAARQTAEQLALGSNNPQSWAQLINLAERKGQDNHQLLYLYRLRLAAGAMETAQDYEAAADLAKRLGFFAEARDILQKAIAAGKSGGRMSSMLADAKAKAAGEERSLAALAKEASASKNGDKEIILGETYWTFGRYAEAEAALKSGLSKGGLKDTAGAHIMLGIALASQGKKDEAVQAFDKASSSANAQPIAHVWTLYAKRST